MTELNRFAPIVLFTYNRPSHTKRTLEALAANELAIDSRLIIYSDAAKKDVDRCAVDSVRALARGVTGFESVKVVERKTNLGLAGSVISGVSEVLDEYDDIIVLEDDLVTSRYFLRYMNEALRCYRADERVISIHAYCPPIRSELPPFFFLRGADCWGWGTWKRAWRHFEPDSRKLLGELESKKLTVQFDMDNAYRYTQMLQDHIDGKNDSWAIRWHASAFLKNMLTLNPCVSLVQNIGLDNSGTHCGDDQMISPPIKDLSLEFSRVEPIESIPARSAFSRYWKQRNRKSALSRIWNFGKASAIAVGFR